jgi:hypothetical protein
MIHVMTNIYIEVINETRFIVEAMPSAMPYDWVNLMVSPIQSGGSGFVVLKLPGFGVLVAATFQYRMFPDGGVFHFVIKRTNEGVATIEGSYNPPPSGAGIVIAEAAVPGGAPIGSAAYSVRLNEVSKIMGCQA